MADTPEIGLDLAPWRSPLARALHRNRALPNARYLQLATLRPNGYPANRTVVFRGFWGTTNQLQIVTDARSAKAEDIRHCAHGEACWYFPKTREQFRLGGTLTLVGQDAPTPQSTPYQIARKTAWQALSDGARSQFMWPAPGAPRATEGFTPDRPDPTVPPEHFCLLLLEPMHVDHLELRGDPQNRWVYQWEAATGWQQQAVNP